MNKIFLLVIGICLMSCSTTTVLPLAKNKGTLSETDRKDIDSINQNKTITLLNQLFNSDSSNKNTVLVINNNSNCDFVMSILGGKSYTLPVAANKTESIVVEQGEYVMRSDVCNSAYLSRKTLTDITQVSIKYSVVNNPEHPDVKAIQQ